MGLSQNRKILEKSEIFCSMTGKGPKRGIRGSFSKKKRKTTGGAEKPLW